jgi:hypothetical protein
VGITGIRGCLGVVYKGAHALYAIHIPPDIDSNVDAKGGRDFAEYIVSIEQNPGKGELFFFVNGGNRSTVEAEAKAIRTILKKPATKIYRIMEHLGATGNFKLDGKSVAIMVKNTIGGLEMTYKHVPDNDWVVGGKSEMQQYANKPHYKGNKVPNDLVAGWYPVDKNNCTITKL